MRRFKFLIFRKMLEISSPTLNKLKCHFMKYMYVVFFTGIHNNCKYEIIITIRKLIYASSWKQFFEFCIGKTTCITIQKSNAEICHDFLQSSQVECICIFSTVCDRRLRSQVTMNKVFAKLVVIQMSTLNKWISSLIYKQNNFI